MTSKSLISSICCILLYFYIVTMHRFSSYLIFGFIYFLLDLTLFLMLLTLLVASKLLMVNNWNDIIVFNIDESDTTILLKP